MTQQLDPTTTETINANQRDLQRAALRDLVNLSAETAQRETQIESEYQSTIGKIEKELNRALTEAEQRQSAAAEQIEQSHQQRIGEIEAHFQREQAAIQERATDQRRRVQVEHDSVTRNVKHEYDQAAWLADSVYEVGKNQARAEYKKSKDQIDIDNQSLDELEGRLAKLLQTYNYIPPEPEAPKVPDAADVDGAYAAERAAADGHFTKLQSLFIAKLFIGARPVIILMVLCFAAAILTQLAVDGVPQGSGQVDPKWKAIGIAAGVTLVASIVLGFVLRFLSKKQIAEACSPLRQSIERTRTLAKQRVANAAHRQEQDLAEAHRKHKLELQGAKEKFSPFLTQASQKKNAGLQAIQKEGDEQTQRIESERAAARSEADALHQSQRTELSDQFQQEQKGARDHAAQRTRQNTERYESAKRELEEHWYGGLKRIQAPIGHGGDGNGRQLLDWNDGGWQKWIPPKHFASQIRFGELRVDLQQITKNVPQQLKLPESFSVPAALAFPNQSSLLIHTDHSGRAEGLRILQMVMARLLTSLPAGRAHFTIIDPVGLGQNFAGFMHLADHDEALVGGRIWTEREHIEQRLANLTEHMETVIQKYLRNEFETIDEYNAQAGELAEPYRFLVIADFPVGFEGDSFRRLSSIASSGARCGVYTLILRDTRQTLPSGAHLDEIEAHSLNLVRKDGKFIWKDDVFRQFPLKLDDPPSEEFLTKILDVVGRHAKDAKRVEVNFDTIAPKTEQFWTRSSANELSVPVGRLGATRLQNFRLGRGVAQHALIAGKTGSGKSTLLHALVTNLAMWYSPDEVEFYLVDFKKGVEFKTYATHNLPHARAIAVESDREFGLSVLQRIDAELGRRGELFRKLGVQDLASYREQSGQTMPRTLLIIDEFQEFFSEDDKLAQDAGLLLDRLVRQGRAFGIHVLLGSQTIGGTSGLARSTIGQMAVRIALQTSEADSQLILGDNNSAARLLTRPGEAIYNDAGGLVEGNSPFQVAWLPDERREDYLARVRQLADQKKVTHPMPVVFEGNAPADVRKNARLMKLLKSPESTSKAPQAWLGEPVAIKEPTAVTFRRQSGANALIIGQYDELAMAMIQSSMISLAMQHAKGSATFYLLDGTPADSPLSGQLQRVAEALPIETKHIEYRVVPDAITELAEEMKRRQEDESADAPSIYVFVYGLQRYRALRKSEESFSFSMSDEEKKPNPDRLFVDLLREGPGLGIYIIAWADTPASVERTFDRASMREFDNRILFQMSAADSSNLIDSPAANKLGMFRALAYSEEQGVMEKFRPYALATDAWIEEVRKSRAPSNK